MVTVLGHFNPKRRKRVKSEAAITVSFASDLKRLTKHLKVLFDDHHPMGQTLKTNIGILFKNLRDFDPAHTKGSSLYPRVLHSHIREGDARYPENAWGSYVCYPITEMLEEQGIEFLNDQMKALAERHLFAKSHGNVLTIEFKPPAVSEARYISGTVKVFTTPRGVYLLEETGGKFSVLRKI